MVEREPSQVALRTITLDGDRWSDEPPGDVEQVIGEMIRTYASGDRFGGLLVRVHPDAWQELRLRIANAYVRWPAIAVVPVMCNGEQNPTAISLSNVRLRSDVICMASTE